MTNRPDSCEPTPGGWTSTWIEHYKVTDLGPGEPIRTVFEHIERAKGFSPRVKELKHTTCERCLTDWVNAPSSSGVFLIYTNAGSKIICQTCFESLSGNAATIREI